MAFATRNALGIALAGLMIALTPLASAAELTAGDVDDNLNFDFYTHWVERTRAHDASMPAVNLTDRVTLRVIDSAGSPVSNAAVEVRAAGAGAPFFTSRTGSDGSLRFFPAFDGAGNTTDFVVAAVGPGGSGPASTGPLSLNGLDAERTFTLTLSGEAQPPPSALDLMIVVDTTGSMSDELGYITKELGSIVAAVQADHPSVDIRYGLVVYRDEGDLYVVRSWNFTASLKDEQSEIAAQTADGGGDMPEAMHAGLASALHADWRGGNTARVMVLIADAPPHAEHYADTFARVADARALGVHIYPLAASGTDAAAEYIMRAAAVLTGGRYMFLTDDSGVGNAHAEPHIACYQVTALTGLIARVIGGELAGARVEAPPADVIRTVGNESAGVCLSAEGTGPTSPVLVTSVDTAAGTSPPTAVTFTGGAAPTSAAVSVADTSSDGYAVDVASPSAGGRIAETTDLEEMHGDFLVTARDPSPPTAATDTGVVAGGLPAHGPPVLASVLAVLVLLAGALVIGLRQMRAAQERAPRAPRAEPPKRR